MTWQFGGSARCPSPRCTSAPPGTDGDLRRRPGARRRGRATPTSALAVGADRRGPARLPRRALRRQRGPVEPARRPGHGRRAALGARGPLDRRQGHSSGDAGRRGVLRRRQRDRRLGQARRRATRKAARSRSSPARRTARSAPRRRVAQDAAGHRRSPAGPAGSAALAWMQETQHPKSVSYAIHASTRPQAGGPFGAEQTISDTAINGLWPSIAINARRRRDRGLDHQHRRQRRRQRPTAAIHAGRTRAGCCRACAGARARAW